MLDVAEDLPQMTVASSMRCESCCWAFGVASCDVSVEATARVMAAAEVLGCSESSRLQLRWSGTMDCMVQLLGARLQPRSLARARRRWRRGSRSSCCMPTLMTSS